MRTTITMEDALLEKLKERAASSGSSVSRLIETAVRVMLSQPATSREASKPLEVVTYGAGGRFSKYNIDNTSELIAAEDVERFGQSEES